jgi:hypothetical protein
LRGNLKSEFTLVSTGCEHTISCNWIETWNRNIYLHYVHKYLNNLMYIHWNDSNPNFSGTICCNKSKQTMYCHLQRKMHIELQTGWPDEFAKKSPKM